MKYLALAFGTAAGLLTGLLSGISASAQQSGPAPPPATLVTPTAQPLPPHRWTVQQARQAFELADTDADGELTRAEAQRVVAMPRPFEEMDRNKDGLVGRAEYEAAFPR